MPKYQYDRIYVSAYEPCDFDPRDPLALRKAVEHLRKIPDGPFIGLVVEISVTAGTFKVNAPCFLKLDQIIGKTPSQVWALLDDQIDRQIDHFKNLSRG